MSYCVNCGVELEKTLQSCPLCGVEVINPKEPPVTDCKRPYSDRIAKIQKKVEHRYAALIVSVLIVLAGSICAMADAVYNDAFTWSLYVTASLALVWIFTLLPFCVPKLHPLLYATLDVCALLLFLYVLNLLDGSGNWYASLAMPLVMLYGVIGIIDMLLWRSALVRGWQKPAAVVASIGPAMMGTEVLLDLYNAIQVRFDWSWFVVIPMLALALVLTLIERKQQLKAAILKRLHI